MADHECVWKMGDRGLAGGRKQGPSVPVRRTPAVYRPRPAGRGPDPATQWLWGGLAALAAVLIGVAVWATRTHPKPPAPQLPNTAPIDGIACDSGANLGYQAAVHLDVLIGGKAMVIPANTGVYPISTQQQCSYWLHTSDGSGVIQIGAPRQQSFTLGQFFDIWGLPLSATVLAGHQVGSVGGQQMSIRAYVNGKPYSGDPSQIPLTPQAEITLEYGPPWVAPKSTYSFPKPSSTAAGAGAASATSGSASAASGTG